MTCRTIASYCSYAEAERAVDHLAEQGFPVERVAIIGRDLYVAECVPGRVGYGEAALPGAISGALAGLLVGWLFGVFNWLDPLVATAWLAFQGLWFGALLGALIGLTLHVMVGDRHDLAPVAEMRADHYEVVVDGEVAEAAACLLASREQDAGLTAAAWRPRAVSPAPAPPAAAPARR